MSNQYEDIEKMLNAEENIAEVFQEVLRENLKELQNKTGMTAKELADYIERVMVM